MSALNAELLVHAAAHVLIVQVSIHFLPLVASASSIRPFSTRMDPQSNYHNPWHHFFSSSRLETEIVRSNSSPTQNLSSNPDLHPLAPGTDQ
jgi:hypothetical protein